MENDKRLEKGRQTKCAIIEASMVIIIEEGRQALTTRRICEKCGIGKGSLYHHFDDLHSVVTEVLRNFASHYFSQIVDQEFTSVRNMFERIGDTAISELIEHAKMYERFVSFIEEIVSNKEFVDEMMKKYEEFQIIIAGKVETLAGGRVEPEILQDTVLAVFTFIEGMEHLLQITRDEVKFRKMWKRIAGLLADNIEKNTIRRIL